MSTELWFLRILGEKYQLLIFDIIKIKNQRGINYDGHLSKIRRNFAIDLFLSRGKPLNFYH